MNPRLRVLTQQPISETSIFSKEEGKTDVSLWPRRPNKKALNRVSVQSTEAGLPFGRTTRSRENVVCRDFYLTKY